MAASDIKKLWDSTQTKSISIGDQDIEDMVGRLIGENSRIDKARLVSRVSSASLKISVGGKC